MSDCPLAPRDHGARTCYGCAGPLTGYARKWCSQACSDRWWTNHAWGFARPEAIRRSGGLSREAWNEGLPSPYEWWTCDDCGGHDGTPEVNHVEPRAGAGYGPGCHHHQTNLQVLCHACHVAETTRQTRERLGIPEGGRSRSVTSREAIPEPLWGLELANA